MWPTRKITKQLTNGKVSFWNDVFVAPGVVVSQMGPLQLSDHVVHDRQTGEQMMHWDMLNKATKFEFSLFLYHVIAKLQRAHSSEVCKHLEYTLWRLHYMAGRHYVAK